MELVRSSIVEAGGRETQQTFPWKKICLICTQYDFLHEGKLMTFQDLKYTGISSIKKEPSFKSVLKEKTRSSLLLRFAAHNFATTKPSVLSFCEKKNYSIHTQTRKRLSWGRTVNKYKDSLKESCSEVKSQDGLSSSIKTPIITAHIGW